MRHLSDSIVFLSTTVVAGAAFLAAGNAWRHDEPWLFVLCLAAAAACVWGCLWMATHLGDFDDC